MSQEIIYTSSPQGLRPGSFGFCTVATTPGMATSLAERLESLSGYRHVYTPGDPKAGLNPVVHSHLILKVGGQKLHVLSRIADAGLDYSQRTNKLAHHVALDVNELVAGGPAWVLAQPGFAETRWAGNPRVLPAGRKAPAGNLSPGICRAWQQATGDAGWAGVLAQNGLDGKRPAYVVFSAGTDVLPLLIEAQSLLPPAKRWEVSFSTFFTRLPPGVDCQWRCVLAGSPEGEAAVAQRGDLVIDLTKPLQRAPDFGLSVYARNGNMSFDAADEQYSTSPSHPASVAKTPPRRFKEDHDLTLGPPPLAVHPVTRPLPLPHESGRVPRRKYRLAFVAVLASCFAGLCASTGLAIFWFQLENAPDVNAVAVNDDKSDQVSTATVSKETPQEEQPTVSALPTPASNEVGDVQSKFPVASESVKSKDDKLAGSEDTAPSESSVTSSQSGTGTATKPAEAWPDFGPNPKQPVLFLTSAEPLPSRDSVGQRFQLFEFLSSVPHEALRFRLLGGTGSDFNLHLSKGNGGNVDVVIPEIANRGIPKRKIGRLITTSDGDRVAVAFEWLYEASKSDAIQNRLITSTLEVRMDDRPARLVNFGQAARHPPIRLEARRGFSFERPVNGLRFSGFDRRDVQLVVTEVAGLPDSIAATVPEHNFDHESTTVSYPIGGGALLGITISLKEQEQSAGQTFKIRGALWYEIDKNRTTINSQQMRQLAAKIEAFEQILTTKTAATAKEEAALAAKMRASEEKDPKKLEALDTAARKASEERQAANDKFQKEQPKYASEIRNDAIRCVLKELIDEEKGRSLIISAGLFRTLRQEEADWKVPLVDFADGPTSDAELN